MPRGPHPDDMSLPRAVDRAEDPPRPHAPSRMALYLAKANGGAGQSVGETGVGR